MLVYDDRGIDEPGAMRRTGEYFDRMVSVLRTVLATRRDGTFELDFRLRPYGRGGAPALLSDVFEPLPWMGRWQTVLLVDGNVGLGGDPGRILGRAAELLRCGGRCVAEFEADAVGIRARWVRLESACDVGPWFRWASVGVDSAATLAAQVGLTLTSVRLISGRVIASLAAP